MQMEAKDLGGGAFLERIQKALSEIVMDICDMNTEAKAARSITAKITFKPNDERSGCSFTIDCKTKLGGPKIVDGVMRLGVDATTGEVDAIEIFQPSLFPTEEVDLPGVTTLDDHREDQG